MPDRLSTLRAVSTTASAFATAANLVTTTPVNLPWRSDLDPRALPSTEGYTASQQAILSSCVELFGDLGYSSTSVRDIAASVGIKSASLYKSFSSKQAMLDALSQLGHEEFSRRQLAAVMSVGDDPRGQLTAAMGALVTMTCEFPRLTRVVNSEVRNLSPSAFQLDQAARVQSARILQDVLARGRESGVFRYPDNDAIPVVFWSLGIGLAGWFPYAYGVTVEELCASYSDVALRIVGADLDADGSTQPVTAPQPRRRPSPRRHGTQQ